MMFQEKGPWHFCMILHVTCFKMNLKGEHFPNFDFGNNINDQILLC